MQFDHREEHRDDHMILVQANLDDMNPEYCSYVLDLLLEAGANDVYYVPIVMKKRASGNHAQCARIERKAGGGGEHYFFTETTTLGLRYMNAACHRLGRQLEQVDTEWGPITVKAGIYNGETVQFAPEFKECEAAAKRHGVPLKKVYEEVRRIYMNRHQSL